MNRTIMAVYAHADDVEIQVGGTLLKYRDHDYDVAYIMSTNNMSGGVSTLNPDGTKTTKQENTVDMEKRRKRECDDAAAVLGTTPIHLNHPQRHYRDENLDQFEVRYGCKRPPNVPEDVPTILTAGEHKPSVQRLKELILEKDPECIFTHSVSTTNPEHFGTALLVSKAYWQAVDEGFEGACLQSREAAVLFGEYNCRWETFVDFTPFLDRKMALIGKHACQMPHAHLPEFGHRLLAEQFGAACGCGAAECFTWVKRTGYRDRVGSTYPPLTLELIQNAR